MTAPTELSTAAEVLLATEHHPFARGVLRRPLLRGWARDGATLWLGTDPEQRLSYLSSLGPPTAVAALVEALLPELPPRQRVTLPRGTVPLLPAWVGLGPSSADWDFRWTPVPPVVQPGEDDVVQVEDDAAVAALLSAASPRASTRPGDEGVVRWLGIDDGSRLLACAADTSGSPGVGHLSSIAVHPDCRGQGLGRTVTAALTRRLFDEGCDVVTLGMYADNDAGRAMYDALGFSGDHRFTSGPLQVRSRW